MISSTWTLLQVELIFVHRPLSFDYCPRVRKFWKWLTKINEFDKFLESNIHNEMFQLSFWKKSLFFVVIFLAIFQIYCSVEFFRSCNYHVDLIYFIMLLAPYLNNNRCINSQAIFFRKRFEAQMIETNRFQLKKAISKW